MMLLLRFARTNGGRSFGPHFSYTLVVASQYLNVKRVNAFLRHTHKPILESLSSIGTALYSPEKLCPPVYGTEQAASSTSFHCTVLGTIPLCRVNDGYPYMCANVTLVLLYLHYIHYTQNLITVLSGIGTLCQDPGR